MNMLSSHFIIVKFQRSATAGLQQMYEFGAEIRLKDCFETILLFRLESTIPMMTVEAQTGILGKRHTGHVLVGLVIEGKEMEKYKLNFTLDAATCLAFVGTAFTGLLFRFVFPSGPGSQTYTWLGLARPAWAVFHNISFLLMLSGISLHLALHWKWITTVAARYCKKTSRAARINFTVDALMFWVFLLGSLSGIIFCLGDLLGAQVGSLWFQMHRGTGTAMVIYVFLHLALHTKWILRMIRTSIGAVIARLRLEARGCKGISIQEWLG
jgi:hypothetical protein